jgi:putative oxidoreductase
MANAAEKKGLHIALWVVQVLLGLMFLMAGGMKLMTSQADLVAQGMAWAGRLPSAMIPFIGISELLGGIGLILPSAIKVMPKVTSFAAIGLIVVMVLGAIEHSMNGEITAVPVNVVLAGMAGFVAWGRLSGATIDPR